MKKFTILLTAMLFVTIAYSQTTYWTAYNVTVDAGTEEKVINAVNKFMKTEVGMDMPSMYLRASLFANSEQDYTHQFVFLSPDKSQFGKMYSGALQQTNEFQLMSGTLGANSKHAGSYLGKSLFTIGSTTGNYTTILSLSVSDPGTYLQAFKKLSTTINAEWGDDIGASLHQVLSGNEENVSHIAVISAPSFDMLLDFWDKLYGHSAFKEFASTVKGIRKVVSNTSVVTLGRYNMPE